MRIMISFLLLLVCNGLFASQRAGEITEGSDSLLTLEKCVELALENNRKARISANNIEAAVNIRKEAFTKYFPEVSAVGMAFWANHDILQYNLLDIIELGLIHKGKTAGIQALQPIFTGGMIYNGNKLAALGEEVAAIRRQQTDEELRCSTSTMYWKLVTLEATRETLHSAIMTLDSLTNEVSAAVEAGLALNNDLLKVKLKRNSYEADMVDLENGIQLMKMVLGQYIGLGVNADFSLSTQIGREVPPLPVDFYVPSEEALPSTPDYKLLGKNIEAKELERKITFGENLPKLALGAGWYYHDLLEQNHNFGAIQLALDIPITAWWGGSYALRKKDVELANAKLEMEDLSELLRINMSDKWNNVTSAHRKMEIESEGRAQSEENLRLNRLYYEAGLVTVSDLLEAETEVKQANDRFINAYGAFQTALCEYLVATGR